MTADPVDETDLATFAQVRPRLFGIAYRITGSATEADDVVQETWVRWQGADRAGVRDAPAFLATVTTRLAINAIQSARARRETYIGPWLPEPVDTSADPLLGAQRAEALELAVLAVLERLAPRERAAYVLREAFDYPYDRIAELLDVGDANVRQIVSRARTRVDGERRNTVSPQERERLLGAVVDAAQGGDLAALEQLLAEDVVVVSDGGGIVHAARRPIVGRAKVANALVGFARKYWDGATATPVVLNGAPGLLVARGDERIALATLEAGPDGIARMHFVVNPEKMTRV